MNKSEKIFFGLLKNIPDASEDEVFENLFCDKKLRVERIVSKGQTTADDYWYDQNSNEFVVVLQGCGIVLFDDKREFKLKKGDSLLIKSYQRHKVIFTDKTEETLWLAFFWD